jgi:hypothetical protein
MITLSPRTSSAAAAQWWIVGKLNGSFGIGHDVSAATDRIFDFSCVGGAMGFFDDKPATSTQMGTSTTTANPWATAQPLLNKVTSGYMGLDPSLTGQQTQAGQNLWGAATSLPNMLPTATNAVQSVFNNAGMIPDAYNRMVGNLSPIAGMSTNPYQTPGFADALGTLTNNITNTVKGQYAGSGRAPTGAGTFGQTLSRGLMQGEAPIIQDQYNRNIGNIMSANQMLGNAGISSSQAIGGNMLQALQGAGLLPSLGMAPATAQWSAANAIQGQPAQNLNQILAPAATLGGMGGTTTGQTYQTGTQTPAHNDFANLLGDVSSIAGMIGSFSDRRLKTDVKDIGRTHDNQKIYSYRFKGSNVPQIGMLADEVAQRTPEAVQPDPATGYKKVRYDRATRKAAQMGMLKAA